MHPNQYVLEPAAFDINLLLHPHASTERPITHKGSVNIAKFKAFYKAIEDPPIASVDFKDFLAQYNDLFEYQERIYPRKAILHHFYAVCLAEVATGALKYWVKFALLDQTSAGVLSLTQLFEIIKSYDIGISTMELHDLYTQNVSWDVENINVKRVRETMLLLGLKI